MANEYREKFPYAFKFLDEYENKLNEDLESLNKKEEINISMNIPNDSDLDSFVTNLKNVSYEKRSELITEYMSKLNFDLDENKDKFTTFSARMIDLQLTKTNQKLERISKIRNDPSMLHRINADCQKETSQAEEA
ncbi:hypothetical protein Catovirus_2_150 [Catovirus CTV1]|uniref:Uncharacterized protein n=1 Tax=Catovirus CTV1 TaxID=1977631 RepID=A0A1V0SBZ4_9VIRU|nr:hypothetical protein Catovirus_2_150 [Catovirus CTV1]